MMKMETVRNLVSGFALTDDDNVYMGSLDAKKERSIGCYNLSRGDPYQPSLGKSGTYRTKPVSFLVHWNMSPRETETAAQQLYDRLRAIRDETVDDTRILFIMPFYDGPIDVGKDEYGVCESVIEARIYFEEKE